MGDDYGDDVDESGTLAATMHRGWISPKDALTGDAPGGVLEAALTGEDHAVSEYEKALQQDLSAGFREVVSRQHTAVSLRATRSMRLQRASSCPQLRVTQPPR